MPENSTSKHKQLSTSAPSRDRLQTSQSRALSFLETVLKIVSYISAIASLLGITIFGAISYAKNLLSNPWMLAAIVSIALMIPLIILTGYLFVSRRILRIS